MKQTLMGHRPGEFELKTKIVRHLGAPLLTLGPGGRGLKGGIALHTVEHPAIPGQGTAAIRQAIIPVGVLPLGATQTVRAHQAPTSA